MLGLSLGMTFSSNEAQVKIPDLGKGRYFPSCTLPFRRR